MATIQYTFSTNNDATLKLLHDMINLFLDVCNDAQVINNKKFPHCNFIRFFQGFFLEN